MKKETEYILIDKTLIDIDDIIKIVLLGTTKDENKVPYVRVVFNEEIEDYFEGFTTNEELERFSKIKERKEEEDNNENGNNTSEESETSSQDNS